jgi:hypothetical protein
MKPDLLLTRIAAASEIAVFGAGKMGQQLVALLRNLPEPRSVSYFLSNSGVGIHTDGLPVLSASDISLSGNYLILVASGRGNHFDIANSLQGKVNPSQVVYLSSQEMEQLKRMAFTAMLQRVGIDPFLLKAMTNDIYASSTMFDTEAYNGSIRRKMFDIALNESAQFTIDHMPEAKSFSDCWEYRRWVLEKATSHGTYLEFGVADGSTLDFFARLRPDCQFFGFDSFIGLPEFWKDGFDEGRFAQTRLPDVPKNVELIKGWFSVTIPPFVNRVDTPAKDIAFIHVDCDLYSSTRDVLEGCYAGLRPGTIIAFDEYFNYPGWMAHEHKAWCEFAIDRGITYRYIAYVENANQVAIEITFIADDKS